MNEDCLKLTAYFGERDRANGGFLADALTEIYARHELATSLVLRGVEGFGAKHHLHTDRLLTLSEDLPIVSVAVDARERIEAAYAEVATLQFDGLVTLERARMLTGQIQPVELTDETKLTVYVGRHERVDGRPLYQAVVDLLHRRGVASASVLLGVDGTAHGVRQRAAFFSRNAQVPLMVIAIGSGSAISAVLPELGALLPRPLVTLERVRVSALPSEAKPGTRHKLIVYTDQHQDVVLRLRAAGAAGATTLRGIWGYHGEHRPHGDTFWQLRRRVPVITVVVDTPQRIARWFEIVKDAGLVTSEIVPGYRAG